MKKLVFAVCTVILLGGLGYGHKSALDEYAAENEQLRMDIESLSIENNNLRNDNLIILEEYLKVEYYLKQCLEQWQSRCERL